MAKTGVPWWVEAEAEAAAGTETKATEVGSDPGDAEEAEEVAGLAIERVFRPTKTMPYRAD